MIHHVSGKLGSGKTMFCADMIAQWLMQYKTVVTNVRLVDGWDWVLSKYLLGGMGSFVRYLKSDFVRQVDFQVQLASSFVSNYQYFFDIVEASEHCIKMGSYREGSRLFIFDEAQLFINSRSWKSTSQRIVEFFTQSRKLGFEVYLVSQDRDSVDRQIRVLADFHYTLKNMGNIRPLGFKIFPNMGLLTKRHPDSSTLQSVKLISYADWVGQLYDTSQLLSKRPDSPVSWSEKFSQNIWVGGCKARYEHGLCRFREIAQSADFRFVADKVSPYLPGGQFCGDMPLITNLPIVKEGEA